MKKCLMALALVGAIAATVVPAGSASASQFDSMLGGAARRALHASKFEGAGVIEKPVYVRCYASNNAFDAAAAWRFGEDMSGVFAYAIKSEKTVYMRPTDCRDARGFLNAVKSGQMPDKWQVFSFSTLLHESLHVQGIKNERLTECVANDSVRWAAMAKGLPKSDANTLSRIAFDMSAKWTGWSYHSISGLCQQKLQHRDWTQFIGQ